VFALKHGAYYYGPWHKDVPSDREHWQYDMGSLGHMTAAGCLIVAKNMLPIVERVIAERHIQ
jgi:hypothetical protein